MLAWQAPTLRGLCQTLIKRAGPLAGRTLYVYFYGSFPADQKDDEGLGWWKGPLKKIGVW